MCYGQKTGVTLMVFIITMVIVQRAMRQLGLPPFGRSILFQSYLFCQSTVLRSSLDSSLHKSARWWYLTYWYISYFALKFTVQIHFCLLIPSLTSMTFVCLFLVMMFNIHYSLFFAWLVSVKASVPYMIVWNTHELYLSLQAGSKVTCEEIVVLVNTVLPARRLLWVSLSCLLCLALSLS